MYLTRRGLLGLLTGGGTALLATACRTSSTGRPGPPSTVLPPEYAAVTQEANGMLMDALAGLRTYDVYQAFRVASAAESGRRGASELAWDPPTAPAWDEASHVTGGLRNRAEQLFQRVTSITARGDATLWRERRQLADNVNELLGLGERLAAYRARLDTLPPGDAVAAVTLLDQAWTQWQVAAARWGLARGELISCSCAMPTA